ncbi:response regulator [Zoogloea sp.]|uniref:response regulator n=1 Tax=Zoogloea sp. TaxID=49181 RepID=UPI00260ABC12|nr:response regulator [uncultured Zoogloea sp.]
MLNTIEIFPWNHNFETGIAEVDAQHRRLVSLLNTLVSHLTVQADAPTLNIIFDELSDYAQTHFACEELIWREAFGEDEWALRHHDSHTSFIDEVLRLRAEEGVKPLETVIEDIVGFLTHWLALHIIESDKRMAKAVLALGEGVGLARAKQLADEQMSGATRAMIDTVMAMYDKLANRTVQLTREINRRQQAEQAAQEAQAALLRSRDAAEAASLAKSDFLASMSHEIRTPMNAITGIIELLRRDELSPRQADNLHRLQEASQHLLAMINDILDMSKIEADKLRLDEAPLKVSEVIGSVVAMVESQARVKGLTLRVDVAGIHPLMQASLSGDATRLKQALLNYLSNALKFTANGSVTLRATVAEDAADSVLLRFEVVDTGIGIAPEALPRLFSRFEQAAVDTTRRYGGSGLGLVITRRLAELMGGQAGAESQPGVGSTFWLTVRLRKAASVADAPPRPAAPQGDANPEEALRRDFAGARVLVVEDNEINSEIAVDLLEDVALAVDTAADGVEAVDKARAGRYDVILMDMQMPRMDGLESTRCIRQLSGHEHTPIVAMTANAFADDRARCMEAGMDDFIAKPVDPDLLFAMLLRWMRARRA